MKVFRLMRQADAPVSSSASKFLLFICKVICGLGSLAFGCGGELNEACILRGFMCDPSGAKVADASAPRNTFLNLFIQVIVKGLFARGQLVPPPPKFGSSCWDEIDLLDPRAGIVLGQECKWVVLALTLAFGPLE